MKRPWRALVKGAAAVVGPAMLARLGLPAVGAALVVVLVAAGVLCWVVSSKDRSDHAAQLIDAARGQAKVPAPLAVSAVVPEQPRAPRRNSTSTARLERN
jgi:hypothetical protein